MSDRATWEREARERRLAAAALFTQLTQCMESQELTPVALRAALNPLKRAPSYAAYAWYWGPRLAARAPVLFRTDLLGVGRDSALDAAGEPFAPWQDPQVGPTLVQWLLTADREDDVPLVRVLYQWRLAELPWRERRTAWARDVLRLCREQTDTEARRKVLSKLALDENLDADEALALYRLDPQASAEFVREHTRWSSWRRPEGAGLETWLQLLRESEHGAPALHFELYRRLVERPQWLADVQRLAEQVQDPAQLRDELLLRHPEGHRVATAEGALWLLRARGSAVIGYLQPKLRSIWGSAHQGAEGKANAAAYQALTEHARREGFLSFWAACLGAARPADWRSAVRGACAEHDPTRRRAQLSALAAITGRTLDDDSALALFECDPSWLRGLFIERLSSGSEMYPKLTERLLEAGDFELLDRLAGPLAARPVWGRDKVRAAWVERLRAHYEALEPAQFAPRAVRALGAIDAYATWDYSQLLRTNALARLLFERSTALYLHQPALVQDLLESPAIHVQALALRVMAEDVPEARALAAQHRFELRAMLLRRLHRRTRLLAFAALRRACEHAPEVADELLPAMRDAAELLGRRYPREELIALIALAQRASTAPPQPSPRQVSYRRKGMTA